MTRSRASYAIANRATRLRICSADSSRSKGSRSSLTTVTLASPNGSRPLRLTRFLSPAAAPASGGRVRRGSRPTARTSRSAGVPNPSFRTRWSASSGKNVQVHRRRRGRRGFGRGDGRLRLASRPAGCRAASPTRAAAVGSRPPASRTPHEFKRVLELNAIGTFLCLKHTLPKLVESGPRLVRRHVVHRRQARAPVSSVATEPGKAALEQLCAGRRRRVRPPQRAGQRDPAGLHRHRDHGRHRPRTAAIYDSYVQNTPMPAPRRARGRRRAGAVPDRPRVGLDHRPGHRGRRRSQPAARAELRAVRRPALSNLGYRLGNSCQLPREGGIGSDDVSESDKNRSHVGGGTWRTHARPRRSRRHPGRRHRSAAAHG